MRIRVAVNTAYGGFGLSKSAIRLGRKLSGNPAWNDYDLPRHCPILLAVIDQLGEKASGDFSCVEIQEIESADGRYRICEYDGAESVETPESIKWEKVS